MIGRRAKQEYTGDDNEDQDGECFKPPLRQEVLLGQRHRDDEVGDVRSPIGGQIVGAAQAKRTLADEVLRLGG